MLCTTTKCSARMEEEGMEYHHVIFLYLGGQRQGGWVGGWGDIQTTLRHFLKVSVKVLGAGGLN